VHEFGVILPIAKGEFVLPNKLATKEAGSGLAALIPAGMRAVPVRANDVVSIAGFVQPGSRVDVLVTATPVGGDEQQTTTVLENVLVLANGTQLERDASGRAQNAPVITLAVSPDDAQKLTLASTEGRIQLALRNPTDTRQTELTTVSTRTLFRMGSVPVAPKQQPTRPKPKATAAATPPPPTVYSVEVYRGDKKDETKFPQ
jgi:pilus assembly protein CpaB